MASNAVHAVSSPPRRGTTSTTVSADPEDSEDEEDDGGPIAGLTSAAKRMLEDIPDSTHANRRPPYFVPDTRITSSIHTTSFAVFGRHVVMGSHHVRVYDTQMSEQPIVVVDLKDVGIDLRVKEPRVTAMCFRPTSNSADEGRYVWCGTKDGHLWELDIKTGLVTDTRAGVHGAAVSYIFRYQRWLLSLDEGGKLHVFEVASGDGESHAKMQLSRTLRVSDKQTFARMVNGKLWTSSGPAHRSSTSSSSRGPTIRVYDPCAPGTMPPCRTLFTSEWTGAVTSATTMPFDADGKVYLGHEGGFVSIWSDESVCLQVVKISISDVSALEGVGERLWAGNRKGQIHVFDIGEKPWQTTNIWMAHP
jgi:hypothetical protein